MKKEALKIAEQIKNLVDQLVNMSDEQLSGKQKAKHDKMPNKTKGASGALSILTEEGFFDEPRDLPAIMNRLKEIGRHYPTTSVSMNLLNLTKRRTFSRIKDSKTKKWQYVLRR